MNDETKQSLIVWWVLWGSLQSGIFVIYYFLGKSAGELRPASPDSLLWLAGIVPVAVSSVIRWVILPRAQSPQSALPIFIFGIALAEITCFLGLFIFPMHKQELFILSALGIFQFIPIFARRFFTDDQDGRGI